MASGIICQSCGIEAPTKHVSFHQNIGMIVMRSHRKIDGKICKRCLHKHFAKMTGTTLLLGPWGYISLIIAPCFVISNVINYLGAVRMPAVPPGAKVPVLDAQALSQLQPHAQSIIDRLNLGEPLEAVAAGIAPLARVTPGQVVKYAVALAQQGRPQAPTYGFPVQPAKPRPVIPLVPQSQPELETVAVEIIDQPD
jgi:hypothetical protein